MTESRCSLLDSPLWVNAGSGDPLIVPIFKSMFTEFLTRDRYGGAFVDKTMGLGVDQFFFAFDHDTELTVSSPTSASCTGPRPPLPYLCAVPFTVTRSVCDSDALDEDGGDGDGEASASSALHMSPGAVSLLTDMITSYHTFLAILPAVNGHVSVSIQTNICSPLRLGGEYIAVSKMDKIGRRILFASVQYIERDYTESAARAVRERGLLTSGSIKDLDAAVRLGSVAANCRHVKSIISTESQKRVGATGDDEKKPTTAPA